MILVTVGTQLPFDRLVMTVDRWLADHPDEQAVAQIASGKKPEHMESVDFLTPARYEELAEQTQLMVAHAGTGSIFTATHFGMRLIIMPRRASLGEHRNEHQLATAKHFTRFRGIHVAQDEDVLTDMLNRWQDLEPAQSAAPASPSLIDRIGSFIRRV